MLEAAFTVQLLPRFNPESEVSVSQNKVTVELVQKYKSIWDVADTLDCGTCKMSESTVLAKKKKTLPC